VRPFHGVLLAAVVGLLFVSCESMLIYKKELPDFKAPADKALCVVVRPMAFTGNNTVKIFCDANYVGATEGNTVLSFPVTPGEHYVIGDATNKSKVKFNFQAGKVYFIRHTVVTVSTSIGYATITVVTSTFKPMNGSDGMGKIESEKGKIKWVQPNEKSPQDNLKAKDFENIKKDYEKWAAEAKNAEDVKAEADYPGY
jgi:hypothetical protein